MKQRFVVAIEPIPPQVEPPRLSMVLAGGPFSKSLATASGAPTRPTQQEADQRLVTFANSNGMGWWHWIPNVWFLVTGWKNFTAAELRTDLQNIYPGQDLIVLDVTNAGGLNWAGFGPKAAPVDIFNWFQETWKD